MVVFCSSPYTGNVIPMRSPESSSISPPISSPPFSPFRPGSFRAFQHDGSPKTLALSPSGSPSPVFKLLEVSETSESRASELSASGSETPPSVTSPLKSPVTSSFSPRGEEQMSDSRRARPRQRDPLLTSINQGPVNSGPFRRSTRRFSVRWADTNGSSDRRRLASTSRFSTQEMNEFMSLRSSGRRSQASVCVDIRQKAAAIMIQSLFRGYRTRKCVHLAELRAQHRKKAEDRKMEILKKRESLACKAQQQQMQYIMHHIESVAALKIQSIFRGIKTRRVLHGGLEVPDPSETSGRGMCVAPLSEVALAVPTSAQQPATEKVLSRGGRKLTPAEAFMKCRVNDTVQEVYSSDSETEESNPAMSPVAGCPEEGHRVATAVPLSVSSPRPPQPQRSATTALQSGNTPSPPPPSGPRMASVSPKKNTRVFRQQRRSGPEPVDPSVLKAIVKVQRIARQFLARRRYERVSEQVRVATRCRSGGQRASSSSRRRRSTVDNLEAMFNVPTPPRQQLSVRGRVDVRGQRVRKSKDSLKPEKGILPDFVL